MTTTDNTMTARSEVAEATHRVISIDIFRGLTIAVMIFVNALAEVKGLPWWTYHALAHVDAMTYVDMVFPFFLFIIGMSLPLSVNQRLKRNPSMAALWLHVALRSLSLLALGLILANAEKADAARMGISGSVWALIALICAALCLNVYPRWERHPQYSSILKIVGLAGVVVMFALFRRTTPDGHVAWIDFSYPEILGLIGCSYFAACLLFIPTRRWRWAPLAWFILLTAFCAACTAKAITLPSHVPIYFWPFGNGAMGSMIMGGVVISYLFLKIGTFPKTDRPITLAIAFAAFSLIAGIVLTPLGISKIRATPTWCLYSVAAATLIFALLYWICDIRRWTRWAFLLRPAGANTLLTYLLPDLWYFLLVSLGITYLDTHLSLGWPAVVKTLLFTVFMLILAAALTKAKLRLQL
jgi:heparan-alpha-glucosaminide N-acetyltransferase